MKKLIQHRRVALLALLVPVLFTGCESNVRVKSRTMKVTTPVFTYESSTEGFSSKPESIKNSDTPAEKTTTETGADK